MHDYWGPAISAPWALLKTAHLSASAAIFTPKYLHCSPLLPAPLFPDAFLSPFNPSLSEKTEPSKSKQNKWIIFLSDLYLCNVQSLHLLLTGGPQASDSSSVSERYNIWCYQETTELLWLYTLPTKQSLPPSLMHHPGLARSVPSQLLKTLAQFRLLGQNCLCQLVSCKVEALRLPPSLGCVFSASPLPPKKIRAEFCSVHLLSVSCSPSAAQKFSIVRFVGLWLTSNYSK